MGQKPVKSTLGKLAAVVPFLALAAITYLVAVTVLGHHPGPADLELAFTAGPGVLLLSIAAGTEQWQRRQVRARTR